MRWNSYERFSEGNPKDCVAQPGKRFSPPAPAAAFVLMFIVRLET